MQIINLKKKIKKASPSSFKKKKKKVRNSCLLVVPIPKSSGQALYLPYLSV